MKSREPATPNRRTLLGFAVAVCLFSACAEQEPASQSPAPTSPTPEPVLAADEPPGDGGAGEAPAPEIPGPPETSWDAQIQTHAEMKLDQRLERHPSDGGGRAWIERILKVVGKPGPLRVLDHARFEVIYEAGPLGIDVGGEVYFQVSPFWSWDLPQDRNPRARGYTTASTSAEGVVLEPVWVGNEILAIGIAGRRLEAGERIEIVYGAGPMGARIDRFSEREEHLFLSVDGNADGIRQFVAESPRFDIAAGPPGFANAVVPTTLEPGDPFEMLIAVLDYDGNAGVDFEGTAEIQVLEGIELPSRVDFTASDAGSKRIEGIAREPGVYRFQVEVHGAEKELTARSNPMVVEAGIQPIRWGDVHGHSNLSDGTGTPEDYFTYAKDYAGLDFAALTDHDHWGMQFLDGSPELWKRIKAAVAATNRPGIFTTLLGYEWTSWLHGHRHVLYFEADGEIYSSADDRYENPRQLWDALEGQAAMTFAHHSAGGPVSTNWAYPPDPVLEPLTEIVSVHGVSEAYDAPGVIHNPMRGNFVRDVLKVGYRFGFIGSGDSHDGHPGLAYVANEGAAGLAAVFTDNLDRASLQEAMRARRTYATNGARTYIEVSIDGVPMGGTLPPWKEGDPETQTLEIRIIGEGAIKTLDIIRSGAISTSELGNVLQWKAEREIPRLRRGEFHYIRVLEQTGATVWSSPIYAD